MTRDSHRMNNFPNKHCMRGPSPRRLAFNSMTHTHTHTVLDPSSYTFRPRVDVNTRQRRCNSFGLYLFVYVFERVNSRRSYYTNIFVSFSFVYLSMFSIRMCLADQHKYATTNLYCAPRFFPCFLVFFSHLFI